MSSEIETPFRIQIHRPVDEWVSQSVPGCIIQPQNSAISLLDERIQTPDERTDLRVDEHSGHESTRVATTSDGPMLFTRHPSNDTQQPGNGSTLLRSSSLRSHPRLSTPNWGAASRAQLNTHDIKNLDDSKLTSSEFFVQEKGVMQNNSTTDMCNSTVYKSTLPRICVTRPCINPRSHNETPRSHNETPRSHNESQRSPSPHSNNTSLTPSQRSVNNRKRRPLHAKRHPDNGSPRSEHSNRISEHSQKTIEVGHCKLSLSTPVTTRWKRSYSSDSESDLEESSNSQERCAEARGRSQNRSRDRRSEGRPSPQRSQGGSSKPRTESTSKVLNDGAESTSKVLNEGAESTSRVVNEGAESTSKILNEGAESTSKVLNEGSPLNEISAMEINVARQERKSTSMEMMVSVNERRIYEIALSGNDLLREHLGFLKFESNDLITGPIEKQSIAARPTTETQIESQIQHSSDCVNGVNAAGFRYGVRKKVENVGQNLTDVGHNVQKCVRNQRQCFKKRVHSAGQMMAAVGRSVSHTLSATRPSLGPKSGSSTSIVAVPGAASGITDPAVSAPVSRLFENKSSGISCGGSSENWRQNSTKKIVPVDS